MSKAREEAAANPFDFQQFRQLRRGDIERRARLEARQDRIRNEVAEVGQPEEPAANCDHADHERDGSR